MRTELPFNCCAVVVTFHPECGVVAAIKRLSLQVDRVIIVDNGSGIESAQLLSEIETLPKCILIRNAENRGIGEGFNRGLRIACRDGFSWVATFDQDSSIPSNYFNMLQQVVRVYPEPSRIGIVAPRLKDPVTGLTGSHGSGGASTAYEVIPVAISSGCLLRSEVFSAVGFFDEGLFMDYVDHDFSLRLRTAGYVLLESSHVQLEHRIGETSRHSFLGVPVKVTNHSPARRYYMTRNRCILYRRYGARFTAWAVNDFICMLKELIGVMLYEQMKLFKMKMVVLGVVHAMTGRRGPIRVGLSGDQVT